MVPRQVSLTADEAITLTSPDNYKECDAVLISQDSLDRKFINEKIDQESASK